ncbi:MAG: adenine deaminase [Chitinophagaceae bacterium]
MKITAQLVDIHRQRIFPATVEIANGRILSVRDAGADSVTHAGFLMPGFIDSHVHIESSMLVPAEFARLAVVHGTVATVSDPHEIANVCGTEGVQYMIDNGNTVPFKFNFGAPSCVPATSFETAGASLNARDVEQLLARKEIRYLSEMMNFPGVLQEDPEVMDKIAAAKKYNKPVDGHAPGLRGDAVRKYIAAGISTDHECFTAEEALEKLQMGMKVIIREGSAARNFDALIDLLNQFPDKMMFCSDDKHPDGLVLGHINQLCQRAVDRGIDVFKVLKAACLNPVLHYRLDVGLLRADDPADFILVEDLKEFRVLQTFIDGQEVAANGKSLIRTQTADTINQFVAQVKSPDDFALSATDTTPPYSSHHDPLVIPIIEALDGQLITNRLDEKGKIENGFWVSDPDRDILKIVVVNRYQPAPVAKAFIRNFGLKVGAIASSVAHDSHNIVAIGVDDNSLCEAVNAVIAASGGVSIARPGQPTDLLPLPVAGLMSNADGYQVAEAYARIDQAARDAGSPLRSPFMTLSFMALLVIPHLKLSDKGLFDGDRFGLLG